MGIGISLILSTHMLLSGFLLQIQQFASLVQTTSDTIYLIPNNDLSFEAFGNIQYELEDMGISEIVSLGNRISEISYLNKTISVSITQTSLERLVNWNWIRLNQIRVNTTLYLSSITNFRNETYLFSNLPGDPQSIGIVNILKEITSDILIDLNFQNITSIPINQIVVKIYSESQLEDLRNYSEANQLSLITKQPSNLFLEITADQITIILLLLQIAMSFLLVLSISYVMITLVTESAPDLRILHMIGYGKPRIFTLFLSQAILASLIATICGFLFSLLFLQTLLPLLTFLHLPYSLIYIDTMFLAITCFQSIIVGILSGLYPAKMGADFYA